MKRGYAKLDRNNLFCPLNTRKDPKISEKNICFVGLESRRWLTLFWSGLLFGIAVLMKQHGVFSGVFAFGVLLFKEWTSKIGQPMGNASLSDINAAIDAINTGFDGCRTLVTCL